MSADAVRFASQVVAAIKAEREDRKRILEEARLARREARLLRKRTHETLEAHLRLGWRLWSAGVQPVPPGLIPSDWPGETQQEELLLAAAKSCAETYERMASSRRRLDADAQPELMRAFGLIGGSASLAHTRLVEDAWTGDTRAALALCVRVIEDSDEALSGKLENPDAILAAAAARRCMTACRRALATLHGWEG